MKDLIEKDERFIFWDNFNDIEDQNFERFLSFVNQYLQKATFFLITKTNPDIPGLTTLPIIKLEGLSNDAIIFAKKLRDSNQKYQNVSDNDLIKICSAVDGHPLAIELSLSLMVYGKSSDEILNHLSEYSGMKKVEDFSKRLFWDIFNHQNTSIKEREFFLKCSIFRRQFSRR